MLYLAIFRQFQVWFTLTQGWVNSLSQGVWDWLLGLGPGFLLLDWWWQASIVGLYLAALVKMVRDEMRKFPRVGKFQIISKSIFFPPLGAIVVAVMIPLVIQGFFYAYWAVGWLLILCLDLVVLMGEIPLRWFFN